MIYVFSKEDFKPYSKIKGISEFTEELDGIVLVKYPSERISNIFKLEKYEIETTVLISLLGQYREKQLKDNILKDTLAYNLDFNDPLHVELYYRFIGQS